MPPDGPALVEQLGRQGLPASEVRALAESAIADGLINAERLRAAIATIDCDAFAHGHRLGVSIGVASDAGYGSHERLLARADAALYRARQLGRNRVCGEVEPARDA